MNYNNKNKNAIIIGAGPSLRRHDQIKILKKYHKKFIVIACDGSLFYLLSNKDIRLVTTLAKKIDKLI